MSFEFEYESPRSAASRTPIRRGGMVWVLWWWVAILGAGASVAVAVVADEVRMIGDRGFWTAVIGIAVVLVLSLPGFSMYRLARSNAHPNWHERVWRPTDWVRLSLLSSIGAAVWCGYLIAIRIAREWPT